jgi:hypothetical protein
MKRFQFFQYAASAVASLGFVVPSGVMAAEGSRAPVLASQAETPSILDVSLGEGGTLNGQVLNAQGGPVSQTVVTVRSPAANVSSAVTDMQGYFSIPGLQGGVYEVKCGGSSGAFRLWTANASPPSANKGVLLVIGGPVSRGQCSVGQCCPGQSSPGQCRSGPRPPGLPTNGQVVLAGLLILGAAGGAIAIAVGNQAQPSGS